MGAVVAFNYTQWIARYPEFNQAGILVVSDQQAQAYFNEATIYHRNDGTGPVTQASVQLALLNMLTAHIAARYAATTPVSGAGQPASPLVGRIGSATEGSVNVSIDLNVPAGTAQWYAQTKYGLDYWTATAPYRTMRYAPRKVDVANPFFYQR